MEHSNHNFSYDHYEDHDKEEQYDSRRVSYSRGRSQLSTRKRGRKRVANAPACGFNGRRGRRWTW